MFVDQWNNVAGGGCFSCTNRTGFVLWLQVDRLEACFLSCPIRALINNYVFSVN